MTKVVPGTLLNVAGDDLSLGEGLYKNIENGQVYATRVGDLHMDNTTFTASIIPSPPSIPSVGQTIIGTVIKMNSRYIGIDIQVIEASDNDSNPSSVYLSEPFKGTIRSQDIWRAEEKIDASTLLYLSYRPGDLIRARIIGVGDASAGFLLSTGMDDILGVVFAKCASSGEPMVPISWKEMICPKTGVKEPRKTAKPKDNNNEDNSNEDDATDTNATTTTTTAKMTE